MTDDNTPTGVAIIDLAELVRASREWGEQEAMHWIGRRNIRRSSRKKVIWWWSKITWQTLKQAERELDSRLHFD